MAASQMIQTNTFANLAAIFETKTQQARLAQANGDKATVSRLKKELHELNAQIANNTKWLFESAVQDAGAVATEELGDLHSVPTQDPQEDDNKEDMQRVRALAHELNRLEEELETRLFESQEEVDSHMKRICDNYEAIIAEMDKGVEQVEDHSEITKDCENEENTASENKGQQDPEATNGDLR